MKAVFVDTFYWVACLNPKDEWHAHAKSLECTLQNKRMVTTDEVLVEVLAHFSGFDEHWRRKAAQSVRSILSHPNIQVIPQSRESFKNGLELYEKRLDKAYSLTDCVSMNTMRRQSIEEVLTGDRHFEQDGFTLLMKSPGG